MLRSYISNHKRNAIIKYYQCRITLVFRFHKNYSIKILFEWSGSLLSYSWIVSNYHDSEHYLDNRSALRGISAWRITHFHIECTCHLCTCVIHCIHNMYVCCWHPCFVYFVLICTVYFILLYMYVTSLFLNAHHIIMSITHCVLLFSQYILIKHTT